MNLFTYNCETFAIENNIRKDRVVRFMKKHFRQNIHYIEWTTNVSRKQTQGGRPKKDYLLTETAYKLLAESYNKQNRFCPLTQKITIMSLENQTIGFITACLQNIYTCERQKTVGKYKVDLCINDSLIVECDEWGHADRNQEYENCREDFLKQRGYHVVRFNPNEENFDLSIIINTLLKHLTL